MAKRPALRDTTVGTTWRVFRRFVIALVVVAVVYLLFSGMVAVSTADKCDNQLHAAKEWNYFPPRWDCVGTPLPN